MDNLKDAIESNNVATLNKLLTSGKRLYMKDKHGNTLLHTSARVGHAKIVQMLLQHCQINDTNNSGETPLHTAALFGQCKIVNILLENGAVVNTSDVSGQSPLHLATLWGYTDVALALINDTNIKHELLISTLFNAVWFGHELIIKSLLNKITVYQLPTSGQSLVHAAAQSGDLKILGLVLDVTGVEDVNKRDQYGITPLQVAIKKGDLDLVEVLVQNGANVYAVDSFNVSCLDVAYHCKFNHIVKFLLSHMSGN